MYSCSHCGSPINGKYTELAYKDKSRVLQFHENPSDCYVKPEPRFNRPALSFDRTHIQLVGRYGE